MKPGSERGLRWMFLSLFLIGGIVTAVAVTSIRSHQFLSYPTVVSWQYAFLALATAGAFVALVRKIHSRVFWEAILTLALFLGTWYLCLLVMPFGAAILVASALMLGHHLFRNVILHDLFYLLGAAGVAIDFAGWLSPEFLLVGLVLWSVYDMLAGPPGGPIEQLAAQLVQHGVVPGAVVVGRLRDLLGTVDAAVKGDAVLVGAGDLVLPLSLVARAAFHDLGSAVIVLMGLLVGAFLLTRKDVTHPRAALPALAAGAAVPFIVLRLLSLI